jgi:hypothetical protein
LIRRRVNRKEAEKTETEIEGDGDDDGDNCIEPRDVGG